jgi:hypothetical protein
MDGGNDIGNQREELKLFYYFKVLLLPMKQYSVI